MEDELLNALQNSLSNRYEFTGTLGAGANSRVYKAYDKKTGVTVAIKALKSSDIGRVKRFQREVDAERQLNHPNIARILESGFLPDARPYMVMEYVKGDTLADMLGRSHRLPLENFVPVFSRVCDALHHAHLQKVFHWDLKPSAIVIATDEEPVQIKVIGFGKGPAWLPEWNPGERLTSQGDMFGDPHYISPELCFSNEIDDRSNVYSLGCVMYEAVTGQQPFSSKTLLGLAGKHMSDSPPPMSTMCPELSIPPQLEVLIKKAMAKEPQCRYQSMHELREDLLQFGLP